ncbi:hypothetical protein NG798_04165 [Ancylothrix sp. C2]|uniref:hypothetical protein n=1 Tax=Ancylothrix sp. D3o TaxID=2953691 RepID=UPI0021BAC6A7|nr:hypothetical protein [Ancylothrix sp. D3o]MCT7948973.1 hypothetical protein [Ancylothrix sp. D3o]
MLKSKRVIKFFVCWWLAVCVCFVVSFAFEGKAQEGGKTEVISQVPKVENVGGKNRQNEKASRSEERVNKGGEKDEDLTTLPPNGGKPVEVSVGVHITNFAAIDEAKENYEVVGYLKAAWKDAHLAFDAKNERQKYRFHDLEKVWHPFLEFVNKAGENNVDNALIVADPDGMVSFSEGFNIKLSSDFDFKRFPFDRQKLKIAIESFRYDETEVVFIAKPKNSGLSKDNFVSLSEWKIENFTQKVVNNKLVTEENPVSRFVGELDIVRNYQFYVGKVFIPMFLIVVISGACFWIDIEYFEALTAIGLTNLLTAIAFSLSIAGSLPKVSYLTFIDGFITISYVFIFLTIIEIVWAHYFSQKGDKEVAESSHRKGRWAFPAGFILGNLFLGLFLFMPS